MLVSSTSSYAACKTASNLPAARAHATIAEITNRVSLGGWVVEFMLRERNGAPFASGMAATGYWLGITAGRSLLPFVTNVLGIKVAITVRRR